MFNMLAEKPMEKLRRPKNLEFNNIDCMYDIVETRI